MANLEIEIPAILLDDCTDANETAVRIARWVTLEELGMFGVKTMIQIARGDYQGRFTSEVRRQFSKTYGSTAGCSPGDVELAAELVGLNHGTDYLSQIYDYELTKKPKD